jgi:hypothetical protein
LHTSIEQHASKEYTP